MTMRQKVTGGTPSPITPPADADGSPHTPKFDLKQFRRLGREMNGAQGGRHHSGDELDTSRIQPGLPDHRK
jgi:hypothetical protein